MWRAALSTFLVQPESVPYVIIYRVTNNCELSFNTCLYTTYPALYKIYALSFFMYRRPILCTLYGAVDFLNVLKKGCWWGGGDVLLVHSEILYVPVDDGWEEVLVHNVLHYVPVPSLCTNNTHKEKKFSSHSRVSVYFL